ncbi:hypothetical protein BDP55DRAFT_161004 [Colletotrichum godetiae]|uniref:Uncharacterized protein n=1 Tax=Colletotrichum godetiae TaxID=1209918 RepID=A0AAJ0ETN9_9PEZI|nr:uncharacterized protein BDP55DRAFT_161004 [Colletotrichum godetiae]KAK1675247.1 hypothetical protein BDP55DRAFT_161004 [Colletotrichum godetiae]
MTCPPTPDDEPGHQKAPTCDEMSIHWSLPGITILTTRNFPVPRIPTFSDNISNLSLASHRHSI